MFELKQTAKRVIPLADAESGQHGRPTETREANGESSGADDAQRERRLTDILREVAEESISALTIDAPLRRTMILVCERGGFDLAHAMVKRPDAHTGRERTVHFWHPKAAERFESFRAASRRLRLEPDPTDGLIGKPLAYGEPQWQRELQIPEPGDTDTRWRAARECGLKSGVAVPIVKSGVVCGVVEWLSTRVLPPDQRLMEVAGSVGQLLGLALERQTLDRTVSETLLLQQRRLGRELHDGLCQDLVGLGMQSRRLQTLRSRGKEDEADRMLGQVVSALDEATDKARAISRGLSPIEIDASGLIEAVQQLAANVTARFDVPCTVRAPDGLAMADDARATSLYYIISEAIYNAARHSEASEIRVELRERPDAIVITIRDDGSGMPEEGGARSAGMGLSVMRHRAAMLTAELEIQSRPGEGTVVTCLLPRGEGKP